VEIHRLLVFMIKNQSSFCTKTTLGVQTFDTIAFKRVAMFIFNIIQNSEPENLLMKLMTNAYFNDRFDGKAIFFRDSRHRLAKCGITDMAYNTVQQLPFGWLTMSKEQFKLKMNEFLNLQRT